MTKSFKGNRRPETGNSEYNKMEFFVQNLIKSTVNTALPVRVVGVDTTGPGVTGSVDVVPLIQMYDGFGEVIHVTTIFQVPYSRIQGGVAALIIDPIVGDVGIAVFSQQDITNLSAEEQKPMTMRTFDMADAMYIGGIINQKPSIYLELTQDNVCNLIAPKEVNITSPTVNLSGNLNVKGSINSESSINADNDVKAKTISLLNHIHGGVVSGSSNTVKPVG